MKKRRIKKAPFIVLFILICLVFGVLYIFKNEFGKKSEGENEIVEEPSKEYNVSFTFAGNVLINSNMWNGTRTQEGYDFNPVFEYVNDIMKKSDVNFYFEQSPLGGKDLGSSLMYNYNSPDELLKTLSGVGFNMASLGSRHAYDKGLTGITNSIKLLQQNKFTYSGINDKEGVSADNIVTKKGVRIGLLSYTMETDEKVNEEYAVNIYSDEKVKKDVTDLKKKVDVIIVSIDWSNITSEIVTEEQQRIAKYISDLGVNILIGDTGYTIQPVVMVGNTLVCYSLGNLLSGHTLIKSRLSAMVDFNLNMVKKDDKTTVSFKDINVLLNYTYAIGNNYKIIPFSKMKDELKDYKTYYDTYKELLTNENKNIKLYAIGE